MTLEQKAQILADKFAAAEAALAEVSTAMRNFVIDANMGPLTRKTFIREAHGVEGALGRLHLNITPFDPRITTQDDGGGK